MSESRGRVFLAGGSGAIGRRLIPRLIASGYEVIATTRSDHKAGLLRSLGASAVVCDVFEAEPLVDAVKGSRPNAIINELTDLPQALNPRQLKGYYAENNRVRTEGTRHLLHAAREADIRRMVVQSAAFWYAPTDSRERVTERHPLFTDAPDPIGAAAATMKSVEDEVFAEPGLEAVVLRYGMFYGPGTWYSREGDVGHQMRKRRYPLIGRGEGVFPFVHIDDAAEATVRALTAPPGIYNVVDDEPAPMKHWLPVFAEAIGAPKPMRVPSWLARLAAGKAPVDWMARLVGADNRKAKEHLGWRPGYPSWRQGFAEGLG